MTDPDTDPRLDTCQHGVIKPRPCQRCEDFVEGLYTAARIARWESYAAETAIESAAMEYQDGRWSGKPEDWMHD